MIRKFSNSNLSNHVILFFMLIGSIFMLLGLLVGDLKLEEFNFPNSYQFVVGILCHAFAVFIFTVQKSNLSYEQKIK